MHLDFFQVGNTVSPIVIVQFGRQTSTLHLHGAVRHSLNAPERVKNNLSLVGVPLDEPFHYVKLQRADMVLLFLPVDPVP